MSDVQAVVDELAWGPGEITPERIELLEEAVRLAAGEEPAEGAEPERAVPA